MGNIAMVVEEISLIDSCSYVMRRISLFRKAGIPEIWTVDQDNEQVTIYRSNSFDLIERRNCDADSLLPDGRCTVLDFLFPGPSRPKLFATRNDAKGTIATKEQL